MPARKRAPRTIENNVPVEIKDDVKMTADETVTDAPNNVNSDENVNPDENVSDTPPAENSGDNSEGKSDDKSSDNPPPAEPKKFDIPENWRELELSEDFAEVIGKRLLKVLAEAVATNDLLKAQAAGDDSAAVIAYAEGDKSSENVKALFSQYQEMKASLDTLFSQLTEIVQTEKGDVRLTPKEIEEKKATHKQLIQSAKHALIAYQDYARDNECGEDVKLFGETVEGMLGARSSSAGAKSSSGNYKQSTSVRPRLGDNGYVKVGDTRYDSFTLAIKAVQKLDGGKDINVGQLHVAWVKTALNSDDLNKWTEIEKNKETTFTVGSEDKPITVSVMVA